MKLSEKAIIILPLVLIAFFVFSSFGGIFFFHNYQLHRITETSRLLHGIESDIKEINSTVQSGILALDDKYAIHAAKRSLILFDSFEQLSKQHPAEADKLKQQYIDYYAKLTSINSMFLEKRLDEGRKRLNELEKSSSQMNEKIVLLLDAHKNNYNKAVLNINIFMATATVVFICMVTIIIQLFVYYANKRRKAEALLTEAKDYTDSIIFSMADALVVVNPDATINTVNRALCLMLGYKEDELKGLALDMLLVDEAFLTGTLLKLIEDGFIRDHQTSFKTKQGEKIPVSLHASVMYKDNEGLKKVNGIVFVARDLREILELQKQLIHSEKMASLGTMATAVAHEIKNPLMIIQQGVEFLKPSLSDNPPLLDVINQVKGAVFRADRIVKGLRVFSRQISFKLEKIDLALFVEDVLMLVDSQLKLKHIKVVRQFGKGLPMIKVDTKHMGQVFFNIIENAIEAMPDGGIITVSFQQIKDNFVELSFADTGYGIEETDLSKVLDPFFTTKSKNAHTGLGLSIANGIVEGHGGKIKFDSAPGKGTCVTLTMPAEQPDKLQDYNALI
ncbi:MAG: PAS domain S-box protein [Nitrospirae bacterium]|nr:PAS domain S-box protein [Nitrospirota bacterium]